MIPDTSTCVWLGLIRTSTSIPPVNSDFKWSDGTSLSLSSPPWILDITLTTGTYASTYYDILTDQMYWTGSSATDTCAVMCMAKS